MTEPELRAQLAAARAEADVLRARLHAIEASTTWRFAAPLLRALDRHPILLAAATLRMDRLREHWPARQLVRQLLRHGLWDPAHYAAQLPPATLPGLDLLRHYALAGRHQGLSPHPSFDPPWYAARAGVRVSDAAPHYVEHGLPAGNPPGPLAELRARQYAALGTALPPGRTVIGVVTYDTPEPMLARALRSVRGGAARAGVEAAILLLDNGPPSSAPFAGEPGVAVLPTGGNVGFGAAHNRLMKRALADGAGHYLAFNPDAALHPDALGALLRMSHAAGGRALVEALQFPAEHTVPYDEASFDTPWASGACLLIPRAVHEAIGGFDDGFFMYCEDVDLSWRARAAGLRVITCPTALVFHPSTNRVLDLATRRRFLESGLRLAVKWGGEASAAHARVELAALGLAVPDLSGLVPVDAPPGIAEFDHDFAYAAGRW